MGSTIVKSLQRRRQAEEEFHRQVDEIQDSSGMAY